VATPVKFPGKLLCIIAVACLAAVSALNALSAVKNLAVITSADSKATDVSLAELVKFCKGTSKAWPDGRNFTLVIKSPDTPELHGALQKLFGGTPAEAKAAITKLNESRQVVKVVETDEALLRTVGSTPGAIGVVDVYSINSSVKVLRVDGKLPFDVGYALKGN
jgi:ABC-type phosphate transport system substrate-binding protein